MPVTTRRRAREEEEERKKTAELDELASAAAEILADLKPQFSVTVAAATEMTESTVAVKDLERNLAAAAAAAAEAATTPCLNLITERFFMASSVPRTTERRHGTKTASEDGGAIPPDDPRFDAEFVDFVLEHISRVVVGFPGSRTANVVETVRGKPFSRDAQIVLDFFAFCVQHRREKTWMLWLCGPDDDDGKSMIVDLLKGVVGAHLCTQDSPPFGLGKINAHLDGKLLVDCGAAIRDRVSKRYENALVELATATTVKIKSWDRDVPEKIAPSFHKLIATCVSRDIVPSMWDFYEAGRGLSVAVTCCGSFERWDKEENGGAISSACRKSPPAFPWTSSEHRGRDTAGLRRLPDSCSRAISCRT